MPTTVTVAQLKAIRQFVTEDTSRETLRGIAMLEDGTLSASDGVSAIVLWGTDAAPPWEAARTMSRRGVCWWPVENVDAWIKSLKPRGCVTLTFASGSAPTVEPDPDSLRDPAIRPAQPSTATRPLTAFMVDMPTPAPVQQIACNTAIFEQLTKVEDGHWRLTFAGAEGLIVARKNTVDDGRWLVIVAPCYIAKEPKAKRAA